MTQSHRDELTEVFLFAYREAGLDAALEAHANAAILVAAGLGKRARKPPAFVALPAIREACELYGLTPKGLMCGSREALFADCRAVAALAMRMQGLRPRKIANALGRRDHTTALAAIRRAERNPALKKKAQEILEKLTGSSVLIKEGKEAA